MRALIHTLRFKHEESNLARRVAEEFPHCDEMFNGAINWSTWDIPAKYTIDHTYLNFSTGYLYANSTNLRWELLNAQESAAAGPTSPSRKMRMKT